MQTSNPRTTPLAGWLSEWNQISRLLRRQLSERYARAGLTDAKAAMLVALASADHHTTQTDLASQLSISESNLCGLIERMRAEGLLERDRSRLDRRKSVLTLTPQGKELETVIEGIHTQFQAELQSSLLVEIHSQLPLIFRELNRCLLSMDSVIEPARRAA